MSVTAIIVAGGMGKRLGQPIPKAFVPLADKEIFRYSLELFDEMSLFDKIVLVVPQEALDSSQEKIAALNLKTSCEVVVGGAERWESVKNGVIASEANLVMIHDAARPFVTTKVVTDLLENIGDEAGIITANPVVDTVREFEGEYCGRTVDRSKMVAVGTPQLFDRSLLTACFEKISTMESLPTDEAMLLEEFGHKVLFAYGNRLNFKVTTPEDLEIAEALLAQRGEI